MSTLPEQDPSEAANLPLPEEMAEREPIVLQTWTTKGEVPAVEGDAQRAMDPSATGAGAEWPLFQGLYRPVPAPQEWIPHLGHLAILGMLAVCGFVGAGVASREAIHFHLFGVTTLRQ